jgi:SAM-dependent methyltransferase
MTKPLPAWENLWQQPEIAQAWAEKPPLEEVVALADRLEAEDRRRVLDIGCGMGRHLLYLASRGFAVTGTDNAPTALAACKKALAQVGRQAELVECDMTALPFGDSSFDGVIAVKVIHHCQRETLAGIIAEIYRLLAPGGRLVWASPTPNHPDWGRGREIEPGTWVDDNHREGPIPHHYCTAEEVRELLREFTIEQLVEKESPGSGRRHWNIIARKP